MALWDMFTKRVQPADSAGATPGAATGSGSAAAAGAAQPPVSHLAAEGGAGAAPTPVPADTSATAHTPAAADSATPTPAPLSTQRSQSFAQQAGAAAPTGALNSQIVQAVQLSNAETASYAASQISTAPDMMISQASGLVAQSAANYFDGVSKLALASQAVLLKKMTEDIANENLPAAAEDALGALATDLLMAAAAAVAAAAGAIEAESASFAIDKIDQSIARYSATLANRKSSQP
ncbi:hypothetical protein LJ656_22125 [Paraburkholderia sp. MMS20-SJTR3]|uniref:Phasin family protein n=1 Tax=Paraburkholderia sejongensis TaxID=2886946 RepID=A0ABS8K081_9BURK|nr:hypothetical protein [Paraburkholderia sp. MMS20-SJTR3]MCC8395289.1 hypothetical protein [Paraburkholderia sp. MMS20-SJTR3]